MKRQFGVYLSLLVYFMIYIAFIKYLLMEI